MVPKSWDTYKSEDLLDLRFCDLGLELEGTWIAPLIERVCEELEKRELSFRPHFWLADEWFSPDGLPGVAVPFYLANKRLMRLEREQMFEVEGGSRPECIKILRHEVGHAIDHAYRLHRRRAWQELFGRASQSYPEYYRPNPRSRRFVQHLDGWYAQSHPSEDWAETFAVWLTPRSRWRKLYAGWPAMKKLEYADELMHEIASQPPKVTSRARPYSLAKLRYKLRSHYERKRTHYEVGYSPLHDQDLRRLFSDDPEYRKELTAASFIRRNRREIRELVARWTGEYEFTLDQILKEMTGRCKELRLRLTGSEQRAKVDFAIMLAVHTVQYLHRGTEWHPM